MQSRRNYRYQSSQYGGRSRSRAYRDIFDFESELRDLSARIDSIHREVISLRGLVQQIYSMLTQENRSRSAQTSSNNRREYRKKSRYKRDSDSETGRTGKKKTALDILSEEGYLLSKDIKDEDKRKRIIAHLEKQDEVVSVSVDGSESNKLLIYKPLLRKTLELLNREGPSDLPKKNYELYNLLKSLNLITRKSSGEYEVSDEIAKQL